MFQLPNENEDLIVKETVSFIMPGNKKQDMFVHFKYFNISDHKDLLEESGKADQEKRRLLAMAKLKSNDTSDEDAMLMLIDEQFNDSTEDCDFEILKEAIIDIEGLKDADNKELPYSISILERILNLKQPRIALIESFNAIHSDDGRKRSKRKN